MRMSMLSLLLKVSHLRTTIITTTKKKKRKRKKTKAKKTRTKIPFYSTNPRNLKLAPSPWPPNLYGLESSVHRSNDAVTLSSKRANQTVSWRNVPSRKVTARFSASEETAIAARGKRNSAICSPSKMSRKERRLIPTTILTSTVRKIPSSTTEPGWFSTRRSSSWIGWSFEEE